MPTKWSAGKVLVLARRFREACVLAAAVDLEVFDVIGRSQLTAPEVARKARADSRAMAVLLDALAALELLRKRGARYAVPADVAAVLTASGASSVLAMCQHQSNCLRRWAELGRVVRTGRPATRGASIRGVRKDAAAFIGGMHELNVRLAPRLVAALPPLPFSHLLDVGGASGTWTIEFLKLNPSATATIFDLPHVIPMARRRLAALGLTGRVRLAAGDFERDPLPAGADLAWVSAIIHQNSRAQNRALFRKVRRALTPDGRIAVRDVVMEEGRTRPVSGALFAVNMLVGTRGGGTFTFGELKEDLRRAGFRGVQLVRRGEGNESVVVARRA